MSAVEKAESELNMVVMQIVDVLLEMINDVHDRRLTIDRSAGELFVKYQGFAGEVRFKDGHIQLLRDGMVIYHNRPVVEGTKECEYQEMWSAATVTPVAVSLMNELITCYEQAVYQQRDQD